MRVTFITSVLVLPINRVTDASVAFRLATLKATSLSAAFSSRKQSRVLTLLFFFFSFFHIFRLQFISSVLMFYQVLLFYLHPF